MEDSIERVPKNEVIKLKNMGVQFQMTKIHYLLSIWPNDF